jgi:signal transduction histidine kinase
MLLSALREHDAALAAEVARRRAEFLAAASLRFGASLDQEITYAAIAGLALPGLRGWCVVDIVEVGGGIRRLAVMHPDEDKRVAARALIDRWLPTADDRIGVPALRDRRSFIVTERADAAMAAAARDPDTLRVLRWLGAGSLLVVPVVSHDVLLGAITFVSHPGAPAYTPADVEFGEALAERCAQALESARLYAAARASWIEAEASRAEAESARADAELARVQADAACAEAQVARDEAEQARTGAEAANSAKSHFLRTMSHELRTPLNAIIGYAQMMELGIHGPITTEQLVDLASIRRSQKHLLDLINEVLHYAKLESGHIEYDVRTVQLSEVLAWTRALVAPQARARGLALTIGTCHTDLVVLADPQKLRQVVVNILSNAVKFTNLGGSIDVSCAREDESVVVRVRDSGIGVPKEKLEVIFEPFVQVSSQLSRPHEGTGLGLAISRELTRGMGGDVTVESTLGVGSTFTVRLRPG